MCLAIPGELVERYERDGMLFGKVDFGGARREVCIAYVPEARPGQYVVVHVGFALSVLDADEAQKTLALLAELRELEEEPAA
jgi:hydrogenase expression/formation protein HypC